MVCIHTQKLSTLDKRTRISEVSHYCKLIIFNLRDNPILINFSKENAYFYKIQLLGS